MSDQTIPFIPPGHGNPDLNGDQPREIIACVMRCGWLDARYTVKLEDQKKYLPLMQKHHCVLFEDLCVYMENAWREWGES